MTRGEFDAFCGGLAGTFHVIQWGGSSVWKVGPPKGPVFAIHSNWGEVGDAVVLKPSEMAAEIWRGAPGVRLAPYLGRAGWLQIAPDAMSDEELQGMISASHAINAQKLTKAARTALGLA
ncbi:MAG: MmcQ/YjbR family DNA-binding protein [Pseudomonadota bacterium]